MLTLLQNKINAATLRLLSGALLITLACLIALWNYSPQHIVKWNTAMSGSLLTPQDVSLEIKKGDSFTSVLRRAGLSNAQAHNIAFALGKTFNPKDLRTDHELVATFNPVEKGAKTQDLSRLSIKLSLEKEVVIEKSATGQYEAKIVTTNLIHDYRHAEGSIENSLYVDAVKQGTHPKIIHDMIQAFSYDVDFQRSFRAGDQYCLLFDYHKVPDSTEEKPGELLYACLTLQGKKIHIYRHTPRNGAPQYFNEKGEAIKKGLLRTPVDGARISSGFGKRKHPVLGFTKVHKGVDFAAPRGTPIMAAGSGKIVRLGRLGSYGNYIKIRHNGRYSTAYAHMCHYGKGLKVGSAVKQGQVIGYVGRTGRATGNHLHYELHENGRQVNPRHVKMMPAGSLKGKELQHFMANKEKIDVRLGTQRLVAFRGVTPKDLV